MNDELQRTEDWFKARLGKATGSKFNDIMTGKTRAGWKNYKAQLVVERITGQRVETFKSAEMLWGTETEPLARLYYTLMTGNAVEECGFFDHGDIAAGVSPDGLVGTDGIIEIKCPNTATHLETLHTGKVPRQYIAQVQGQLWITGRQWADFVSFDPRLGLENVKIIIIRVQRDENYIKNLEGTVMDFLQEVDDEVKFVMEYGKEKNVQP